MEKFSEKQIIDGVEETDAADWEKELEEKKKEHEQEKELDGLIKRLKKEKVFVKKKFRK